MRSRFIELYNLVMEDINTQRKPIQKVDQMLPKDFVKFLKEFLPYVKNGKADLNDIRVSEKVDGQAFRLITSNGNLLFESAYSGVTTWDKVPMKEAAKFIYDNYSKVLIEISKFLGTDFKIVGELIWIDEMEESGKVTPVAASYLTNKFGEHGGIVIFDILKVENDNLVPFDDEQEKIVFDKIRALNSDKFSFHLVEKIDITKNVNFTLNADELLQLISDPEYEKPRLSPAAKQEIMRIKENVCGQLSQIVDRTKGAFSEEGDLIEGIVVKILSSGNQYGMFSNGYKDMKHRYWEAFNKIDETWIEFFNNTFGVRPSFRKKIIPILDDDPDHFRREFETNQPIYKRKIESVLQALLDDDTIPKAAKRVQVSMAKRTVEKLAVSNYDSFIKQFVRHE